MLNSTLQGLLVAAALHAVNPSWVGMVDREGFNASGDNDSTTNAQDFGSVAGGSRLTISGWVDIGNPNDVDFYRFSVSPLSLELFFDIDFAEDLAQTGDNDLGLDTSLWIFDDSGVLIAWNDDSDFFEVGQDNTGSDPGSDGFADHDSFIGGLSLSNGTYFAAVSYFGNDANALFGSQINFAELSYSGDAIIGAEADSSFGNQAGCVGDLPPSDPAASCSGQYQLEIRTRFSEVPEPASWALIGLGLLVWGYREVARYPPRHRFSRRADHRHLAGS
jgi:hypothetical protein